MNRSLDLSSRHYIAYLLPVLYVAAESLRDSDASLVLVLTLLCLPLLIVIALRWTEHLAMSLPDLASVGETAVTAFRIQVAATGTYLAAVTLSSTSRVAPTVMAMVLPVSQVTTLVALARVPEGPGLLRCAPAARRLDGVMAVALVGAIGTTAALLSLVFPNNPSSELGLSAPGIAAFENLFGLGVIAAVAVRLRFLRKLELALAERMALILLVSAGGVIGALLTYPLRQPALGSVSQGFAVLVGLAIAWVLLLADAERIAHLLRAALALVVVGIPLLTVSAVVIAHAPESAALVAPVLGVIFLLAGALVTALVPRFLKPMAPWLEPLRVAQSRVTLAEPKTALRAVLMALRDRLEIAAPSPLLFRTEANDAVTVDRAGYLHERPFTLPPDLGNFCHNEPLHTLRLEVARALEVRHPGVRPVLAWMEANGFGAVTSLQDQDETLGFLIMPRGRRRTPLTFLEVTALDQLAERLTAVVALSAALVASRQRQLHAEADAATQHERADRLHAQTQGEAERIRFLAQQLAHDTRPAGYSPAVRMLAGELLRPVMADHHPLWLRHPPGADVLPWIAKTHLQGPRAGGPLLVLDATRPELQSPAAATHLEAAGRLCPHGTLVICHALALPKDARAYVQRVATARPGPYVVLTTLAAPAASFGAKEPLAFGESEIVAFPPLSERGEDIRPLAFDILGRLGLALRGTPLGLDDTALVRVLNEPWPANEQELRACLLRASLFVTTGSLQESDITGATSARRVALASARAGKPDSDKW